MTRMAAFRFTARDDPLLTENVRRHIGARRFAYNRCLEVVKDKLAERRARPHVEVPWSGYSLINWWNAWKRSEDAGRRFAVDLSGRAELVDVGLSWRNQVSAQVFEEAAVDLGRALAAFSASKKGARRGGRVGFPHFQKKGQGPESFRLRNKVSRSGHHCIRVGEKGPRSLTLPAIGPVAVREDTRRLRRMLRPRADGVPRARICSATVTLRRGRIVVTLTCELADLHEEMRHRNEEGARRSFVGVDRGLSHLVVVAGSDRFEWDRIDPPRHLVAAGPALARASRSVSRKVPGSANRKKAIARLGCLHARVANRRHDFTHRLSSQIAKTHGAICIEDLAVKNMVKNHHLARSISDAAWGEIGSQLRYKADWYGAILVVAPRFFASSKTCSSCGWVNQDMTLADRVFACQRRDLVIDRDTMRPPTSLPGARPSTARPPGPRTPKHGAGSPKPVEGGALAITSVTVELLPRAPIGGRSRNRSPRQRNDRTPEKGGQQKACLLTLYIRCQ
jgi:putative transposase